MEILIMTTQLILGLCLLVLLHEWGHYYVARIFGIRVEKFYVFVDAWGKKLFSFRRGDTEFGLGWLPIGGYVKIAGMVDESVDKDQLAAPPKPDEFRSKPAWQRLIVMIGGVTVNAILGIFLFAMILWYWGEQKTPMQSLPHGLATTNFAEDLGLKAGDRINSVNGKPVQYLEDLYSTDYLLQSEVMLEISRDSRTLELKLPGDFFRQFLEQDKGLFLTPRMRFAVGEVAAGMPAQKAGVLDGDSIVAINGQGIMYFDEVQKILKANKSRICTLSLRRSGAGPVDVPVKVSEQGTIGFYPAMEQIPTQTVRYSVLSALPAGARMGWKTISDNLKGFGMIFRGEVPVEKSLGGPIAIAKKMYGGIWDWQRFWTTTALLSMVLAIMNLLPIPALDGGHVVFLMVEMITGRPLSEKFLMAAQYVGMVLLILLMVFAFGNDLLQHVFR
ncbi:MAG: RIP metalloprotease RseP [Sphingobacteriia bacterium]|nr:RIP metalloprotease RseP [Sphingobacteriia bacterium]